MAITDFGFGGAQLEEHHHVASLELLPRRGGMHIRPSEAAAGFRNKLVRLVLSSVTLGVGAALFVGRDALNGFEIAGLNLFGPLGLYLMVAALIWITALLRRPMELLVDSRDRVIHLVRFGWTGAERSRQTIRFEEIKGIELIDHVPTLDMRAQSMNWDMGRLDVHWQKSRVNALVTGDVAELEVLLTSLRRDVGLS